MQPRLLVLAGLALPLTVASFVACGDSEEPSPFAATSTTSDSGGAPPSFEGVDGSTVTDGSIADNCASSAKLIYLTSAEGDLWSFDPGSVKYTKIGKFDCLQYPTHMTVDRSGNLWVVDVTATVFKASSADAKCTKVPTWTTPAPDAANYGNFALTFIGTSNTEVDNTLYTLDPTTLKKFDVPSGVTTTVGAVAAGTGDLTSNGDGTLYFLQTGNPPVLRNFDPATGAQISTATLGVPGGGNTGFAFWGGVFYVFQHTSGAAGNSDLYTYNASTKETKKVGTADLNVTGAAQSTCVPRTAPLN